MRILIIEDDHKIAGALKKGLEQESFAVDVCFDGQEGLGSALTIDYDLIVLDRMLPGVTDGILICQKMRQENIHSPVIILTAKDKLQDKVEGLNIGADDYLVKPFAFEEFLARVKALLRRPAKTLKNILTVGDLVLDQGKFEVKRAGKKIVLTKKEFSLLEYLMRNTGRVVTKDMIIGHVWDFDADILPNTVEVYIGYLRKKIDKPFLKSKCLIQTVHGFGYRLGEVNDV
ncbi:MAG: response regulator transcription factor [Candidatus Berkelbacteria bacterium]